jgi:hypothetical protein
MMMKLRLIGVFLLVTVPCAWSQSETGLTNICTVSEDGLRDEGFRRGTNFVLHVVTARNQTVTVFPAGDHTVVLVDSNRNGTVDSIMVSKRDTNGLPCDVVEVYTRDPEGRLTPVSDAELRKRQQMAAEGSASMVEMQRKMRVTSTNVPARQAIQRDHK